MYQKKNKVNPRTKIYQSLKLYSAAKELKAAALRKFYPELTETEINKKVKDIFLYART